MKIPLLTSSFLLLLLASFVSSIQAQTLQNEVISAIGSSHQLTESSLTIHQSIGQSTAIGSFTNSPSILMQGFLRGVQPSNKEPEGIFDVIPYPNSFSKSITFRFVQKQVKETHFTIYDIRGKKVFDQLCTPIDGEVVLNLNNLASGLYLTFIQFGNTWIEKRIIKIE